MRRSIGTTTLILCFRPANTHKRTLYSRNINERIKWYDLKKMINNNNNRRADWSVVTDDDESPIFIFNRFHYFEGTSLITFFMLRERCRY